MGATMMVTKTMNQTTVIKMARTIMMMKRLNEDAKMDEVDVEDLVIMTTITADNDVDSNTDNIGGR